MINGITDISQSTNFKTIAVKQAYTCKYTSGHLIPNSVSLQLPMLPMTELEPLVYMQV